MITGLTIDEALNRAMPGLRYRIEESVRILRKAESLALRYDPENGFFLAFSGGKDSQALYHVAELSGVKFKAHFSPTTVDPPQLIRFIRKQYPEVEFGKVSKSIYQIAKEKGAAPTMRMRWCCAEFKENAGAGRVTLTGVRKEESVKRSKRNEIEVFGHKFSGDFQGFGAWQDEQIRKKYKRLNDDEFSRENKVTEIRCIGGKDKIIVNPILDWTSSDIWQFLNDVMIVPHCELYDPPYRQHRIGCILCPMASHKQKLHDCELFPYAKRKWLDVFDYYLREEGYTSEHREKREGVGANIRLIRDDAIEIAHLMRNKGTIPNHELSSEILFDWWISGKSWNEFKADLLHPKLFE